MLGGNLHQAGMRAAAVIVALDTMVERLANDHRTAKQLAEGLTHKVCAACKTDKPIDAFTEAWRSYCAECTRAQAKKRYRDNGGIEKVYAANLATNYNMTPEQYAAKMEAQQGRCAICGNKPTRRLHVDHDHKTGALRDLLCSHCNHAIGHAKEDPARLRAMSSKAHMA